MIISSGSIVLLLIASVLENINNNCHALRLISPEVIDVKYSIRIISSTTILKIYMYIKAYERHNFLNSNELQFSITFVT